MDAALATAFLPRPHHCCGFDLAPLALRHLFLLEALESPCALGGPHSPGAVTFEDLFSAARLCALKSESEVTAWLASDLTSEDIRTLAEGANHFRPQFESHKLAWNNYLRNHTTLPRLLPIEGTGKWQIHWLLITVAKLMHQGHMSPEAAWWTPLSAARWYVLALDELDPKAKFTLITDDLRDQLRTAGHEI